MRNYEVYRADEHDLTYTQNFYGMEDRSLNLLKSKGIINPDKFMRKNEFRHNESFLKKIFTKNDNNNRRGTVKIDKNVPVLDERLFFTEGKNDQNVVVKNSRQKSDLYHFKVMRLKSHGDTNGRSKCDVLFHFFFDIFRQRQSESKDKLE